MKRTGDIYTGKRGAKIRLEVLVPESLHRLVSDLSVASNRTVTDLVIEGLSIIADGYKGTILTHRQERRKRLPSTSQREVLEP